MTYHPPTPRVPRAPGGWYRGPAAARFDCDDCWLAIEPGSDVAVKDRGGSFVFLHGHCYELRRAGHRALPSTTIPT